jgi:enoyl-CoA hydratase
MRIDYTTQGGLGRIELHNPPDNALDSPAFEDEARLCGFLAREDLKAVVVRGFGRNFSSGADLGALRESTRGAPEQLETALSKGKRLLEAIRYADLPVIAEIRGACLGGGLEIALSCHFRFASANAMLGFPEVERGLMPGLGGTLLSQAGVRRGPAIELLLSGRMIRGDEAAELGLVDAAMKTAELSERTETFARALTANRTRAQIRNVMTAAHNAVRLDRERALAEETRLFLELAAEVER